MDGARVVFGNGARRRLGAGDLIGEKYRLDAPIALGGMGTVWRAHNETLGTPIAIKFGHSDGATPAGQERLLTEAKAAALLDHPAIVRVFDFGIAPNGDPFVVMELLSGESLRDLLDREHTIAVLDAIRIVLPVLAGIEAAHAHGIVHRDLKPENIFLARHDGGNVQPKIVDFGIAKMAHGSRKVTTKGTIIGSPEYMAPEQASGEQDVDGRVDVWSAGVVLYEMIAGRTPWSAPNCPAVLRAILSDEAPTLSGKHGVDPSLWSILELAFAKDRNRRWNSARELGNALACWLLARGCLEDISGASLRACWPATQTARTVLRRPAQRLRSRRMPGQTGRRGRSRRVRRVTSAGKWALAGAMTICAVLCVIAMRRSAPSTIQVEQQPLLVTEEHADVTAHEGLTQPPVPEDPEVNEKVEPPAPRPGHSARPSPSSSSPPAPARARQMDFGF